jgi:hypothetical protein
VEGQRKVLADRVDQGKDLDEKSFNENLAKYKQDLEDHREEKAFAERVLRNEPEAMLEAVKLFEPLASIALLGEHLSVAVRAKGDCGRT